MNANAIRIAALLWKLNHDAAGRPVRETLRIVRELEALGHNFAA